MLFTEQLRNKVTGGWQEKVPPMSSQALQQVELTLTASTLLLIHTQTPKTQDFNIHFINKVQTVLN